MPAYSLCASMACLALYTCHHSTTGTAFSPSAQRNTGPWAFCRPAPYPCSQSYLCSASERAPSLAPPSPDLPTCPSTFREPSLSALLHQCFPGHLLQQPHTACFTA